MDLCEHALVKLYESVIVRTDAHRILIVGIDGLGGAGKSTTFAMTY